MHEEHTLVDAYSDGKEMIGSFIERDDISELWREPGRRIGGNPTRAVLASVVRRVIRYHPNVSQVRKTDGVIFPRIPRTADIKLSIQHDAVLNCLKLISITLM